MKICKTHPGKEFKLRDGSKGPFYSHVISGDKDSGYVYHNCDLDKIDFEVSSETPKDDSTNTYKPRDFDAEARGKVRNSIVAATIAHDGLEMLTLGMIQKMERYVDYIMNGPSKNPVESNLDRT